VGLDPGRCDRLQEGVQLLARHFRLGADVGVQGIQGVSSPRVCGRLA
jgi:hypothetical protein